MGLCKTCRESKVLRVDGFCSTACFNKTKAKGFDGYKECPFCKHKFAFRSTLRSKGYFSKVLNHFIAHTNQKFCSKKCSLRHRNLNANPAKTIAGRKKISDFAKKRGTKHLHTKEMREKQRRTITGEGHWNWQGGKTSENRRRRNSLEMKAFRAQVFERDNYTCVFCKARNGNGKTVELNADHVKPFSLYPELRFDVANGRTLCIDCHKKTDTYMGRIKTYKKRLGM